MPSARLEIGVLKAIGLQANQVTLMFLIEALLLGILGSILGVVLGLGLVTVIQGVAERTFAQTLQFMIFPEAIVMGLVTGVLVTLVCAGLGARTLWWVWTQLGF